MKHSEPTYSRGLTQTEVAVIKGMRLMGLPRDYVMSFIVEPGRIISPAAVDEVVNGKIGPLVEAASYQNIEAYVREKLSSVRPVDDRNFKSATSSWRIQQALSWSMTNRGSLLPSEGYDIEFKLIFKDDDKAMYEYMKTIASLSNVNGGYIFFGIADDGKLTSFNAEKFSRHKWERFDQILQETFRPNILWEYSIAEIPENYSIRLDERIVKRIAEIAGKNKEDYEWLISGGYMGEMKFIGAIYAYPQQTGPTMCKKSRERVLKKEIIYHRLMKRNEGFTLEEYNNRFPPQKKPPKSIRPIELQENRLNEFRQRCTNAQHQKETMQLLP